MNICFCSWHILANLCFFSLAIQHASMIRVVGYLESKTFEMAAEIHQELFGTCCVNKYLAHIAGAVRNCIQLLAKTTKAPKPEEEWMKQVEILLILNIWNYENIFSPAIC